MFYDKEKAMRPLILALIALMFNGCASVPSPPAAPGPIEQLAPTTELIEDPKEVILPEVFGINVTSSQACEATLEQRNLRVLAYPSDYLILPRLSTEAQLWHLRSAIASFREARLRASTGAGQETICTHLVLMFAELYQSGSTLERVGVLDDAEIFDLLAIWAVAEANDQYALAYKLYRSDHDSLMSVEPVPSPIARIGKLLAIAGKTVEDTRFSAKDLAHITRQRELYLARAKYNLAHMDRIDDDRRKRLMSEIREHLTRANARPEEIGTSEKKISDLNSGATFKPTPN